MADSTLTVVRETLSPSTIKSRLGLSAILGASALGISLSESPVAFVRAVIIEWFLGGVLTVAGIVIGAIQAAFEPFRAIPRILADALGAAFGPVADAALWLPRTVEQTAVELAADLGPFAPFVLVPLGVVLVVSLFALLRLGAKLLSPRIAALLGVD